MDNKDFPKCNEKSMLYYLKKINLLLNGIMNDEFKKYGMTESQARTLIFISFKQRSGKEVKQKDIEDYFGISHATVNGLIARLKNKGYADYKQSSLDKRVKLITITESGVNTMSKVNKVREAQIELLNGIMSKDELDILNGLLLRMITELEETKSKRSKLNDKNI